MTHILGEQLHIPPRDPAQLTRYLALEGELESDGVLDEEQIYNVLEISNKQLATPRAPRDVYIHGWQAYQLPDYEIAIELLRHDEILNSRIGEFFGRGRIDSICWFGSVAISGFGLRMYGVEMRSPEEMVIDTLFVPVDDVISTLAASAR